MLNIFDLYGKTALVTGASRGIGKIICCALLDSGAKVIAVSRNMKDLKKLHEERMLDPNLFIKEFSVTAFEYVDLFRDDIEIEFGGKIDILVNNAGVSKAPDESYYWDDTFDTNVKAVNEMIKEFSTIMPAGSSIINVTSINSEVAFPNNPAYVASKGALKMLTKAWAVDLAEQEIRVNNLELGYFHTSMTDKSWNDTKERLKRCDKTIMCRWGEEKDLYGPVIFLASGASRYCTGMDLRVDGGWLAKGL